MDVHGGNAEARQSLDLVLNLGADRGGDLGQVKAVLDDDMEVERHRVALARDRDPVQAAASRLQSPYLGPGAASDLDDAVAA